MHHYKNSIIIWFSTFTYWFSVQFIQHQLALKQFRTAIMCLKTVIELNEFIRAYVGVISCRESWMSHSYPKYCNIYKIVTLEPALLDYLYIVPIYLIKSNVYLYTFLAMPCSFYFQRMKIGWKELKTEKKNIIIFKDRKVIVIIE